MRYVPDRGEKPNNAFAERTLTEGKKIDGDRVQIMFGPEVMKGLKRLHKAVRGTDHENFDDDLQHMLGRLASGNPVEITSALNTLMHTAVEVEEYTRKTGDRTAKEALLHINAHILGQTADAKPITALLLPSQGRSR